eukprot:CAMPEP_0182494682 /NCGR_PEP_ID=MMETSP1321-20130603/3543_1 /TAXON_ID=91990 /ORGANISM="Bolidomonas sp., Strain RCC1657" /LENGTH=64 /DNA_ID=CAMNT_0024697841 /DNA_START=162 /DNA_END=356 /DNA_ORIENTATION=-
MPSKSVGRAVVLEKSVGHAVVLERAKAEYVGRQWEGTAMKASLTSMRRNKARVKLEANLTMFEI